MSLNSRFFWFTFDAGLRGGGGGGTLNHRSRAVAKGLLKTVFYGKRFLEYFVMLNSELKLGGNNLKFSDYKNQR